jgi:import receptor subunit TOM20
LDVEARKAAQEKFLAYIKKEDRAAPLLVARFIARQIALETTKLARKVFGATASSSSAPAPPAAAGGGGIAKNDFTDAEGGEFLLADHMERLRYLAVKPSDEDLPLISAVLEKTLPGLEQFVTDERHSVLLGKMLYNAIGVGNRNDKVRLLPPQLDLKKK